MIEKIKNWYNQGFWTENMIRKVFEKQAITEEQLNEILNSKILIQEQEVIEEEIEELDLRGQDE